MVSDVYQQMNNVISELVFCGTIPMPFTLEKPFLPLQQLLAVEPLNSMKLLPKALAELMYSKDSKLAE